MKRLLDYSGILGILFLLAGGLIYIILSTFSTLVTIFLIVGGILLLVYVVGNLGKIQAYFSKRSTKYSTNAVVTSIIVLAILMLVDFVAFRHTYRIDTTANHQYSLSEQTRKVLKNLKKDVHVIGFFKSEENQRAKDLFEEYSHLSPKFSYELVDPDKRPAIARKYGRISYGTIIVEGPEKTERIQKTTEEELTNAIIKVTREGKKWIYFLEGHGEHDIDQEMAGNKGGDGMAVAKKALENQYYGVKKLMLVTKKNIPADCNVLVIAGPQTDLLQPEIDAIQKFLVKGGKVLALIDPPPSASLRSFLAKWGVIPDNDVVLDFSGVGQLFGAGPAIPVASRYGNNPIVKDLRRMITAFPLARSLSKEKNADSKLHIENLVMTGANSWGETNLKLFENQKKAGFDKGQDKKGPLTLGMVVTKDVTDSTGVANSKKKSRLVVFGDSDFATNAWFHFQKNGDLFLNSVNWLAEEEDLVAIRPRSPEDRRVNLTKAQSKMLFWIGVVLFPLAIVLVGIGVYAKRRR